MSDFFMTASWLAPEMGSWAAAWIAAVSAAVLVIMVLRPIARRAGGARWVLRLWWILPLALAAMTIPKHEETVPIPVPTAMQIEIAGANEAVREEGAAAQSKSTEALPLSRNEGTFAKTVAAPSGAAPSWLALLAVIWLVGAIGIATRMIAAQRRFTREVAWRPDRRGVLPPDSGPAVIGALSPRLVVPVNFAARESLAERRLILLHEYQHLRRRDGLANLAMSALLVLQWFNPLMHWASRALCRDQESACDEFVIARHPSALRIYANALLKTHADTRHLPLVCRWPAYHPIVERIAMLKSHRNAPRFGAGAAALLFAGCALAGVLAYAAVPATVVEKAQAAVAAPNGEVSVISSTPIVAADATVTSAPPLLALNQPTPLAQPSASAQLTPLPRPNVPTRFSPAEQSAQHSALLPTPTASSPAETPAPPPSPSVAIQKMSLETPPPTSHAGRMGWSENARFSIRFGDTPLQAIISMISGLTRVPFSGKEQLRDIKLTVQKRNVPALQTARVLLSCTGFALKPAQDSMEIVRAGEAHADPAACIEALLPDGPAPAPVAVDTSRPDERYDVETTLTQEGMPAMPRRVNVRVGEVIDLSYGQEKSVECVPSRIGGQLYMGCKARDALSAGADGGRMAKKGSFLKVEFGKPLVATFDTMWGKTSVQLVVQPAAANQDAAAPACHLPGKPEVDRFMSALPASIKVLTVDIKEGGVYLVGRAESLAEVSMLMREVDRSAHFASPNLLSARKVNVEGEPGNEFSMSLARRCLSTQAAG